MANSFSLELTFKGIRGAQDALKEFESSVTEQLSEFLDSMGQIVVDEMQSTVAVDTGELQDSIGYNVSGDDLTFEATADHAGFIEYGTSKMEAQPYFFPAIDRNLGSSGLIDEFGKDALSNWDRLISEHKDT
jgi:HK97 gp10 family phage protein